MTLTNKIRRSLSIAALAAIAAGGAVASAATIGPSEVLLPGAHIPINFAGYKEPADNKLPANHRIIRKQVEVARGERASVVLTAPRGFRPKTIGFAEGGEVGGGLAGTYRSGARSVRVTLHVDTNRVGWGETGHGAVYLLARRAG